MNIEEDDVTRPVLLVGDRLGHVHIGEPTLSNDLSVWRNLWDDGPEPARGAREYLVHAIDGAARVYS